jgi:hypothetical protein
MGIRAPFAPAETGAVDAVVSDIQRPHKVLAQSVQDGTILGSSSLYHLEGLLHILSCLPECSFEAIKALLYPSRCLTNSGCPPWSLRSLLLLHLPQVSLTRIEEAYAHGPILWLNLLQPCHVHPKVYRNPGNQGLVRQCKTLVQKLDRHHGGSDHGAIVDGSLRQHGI